MSFEGPNLKVFTMSTYVIVWTQFECSMFVCKDSNFGTFRFRMFTYMRIKAVS